SHALEPRALVQHPELPKHLTVFRNGDLNDMLAGKRLAVRNAVADHRLETFSVEVPDVDARDASLIECSIKSRSLCHHAAAPFLALCANASRSSEPQPSPTTRPRSTSTIRTFAQPPG